MPVIPAQAGASADGTSIQRSGRAERLPPLVGEMSEGQRGRVPLPPTQPLNPTHTHTTIPLIAQHSDELTELCRRYHVKRLDVFGSAAVGDFNPDTSDIDFLVESTKLKIFRFSKPEET